MASEYINDQAVHSGTEVSSGESDTDVSMDKDDRAFLDDADIDNDPTFYRQKDLSSLQPLESTRIEDQSLLNKNTNSDLDLSDTDETSEKDLKIDVSDK